MKNYFLFILLISFIYPRRDCLQQRELDRLERFWSRPELQDSTLSPKGHFYIHYDTTETNLLKALNLAYHIITNKIFKNDKVIDLRIYNHVISTYE